MRAARPSTELPTKSTGLTTMLAIGPSAMRVARILLPIMQPRQRFSIPFRDQAHRNWEEQRRSSQIHRRIQNRTQQQVPPNARTRPDRLAQPNDFVLCARLPGLPHLTSHSFSIRMNNPSSRPDEQEEFVEADDRRIGKAFRWSLAALLVIVCVAAGAAFFLNKKPPTPAPQISKIAVPVTPESRQAEIPITKFTDVTKQAGISFVHNNGAYGEKLLPETMGGGVAFFDFDNDGHQDLLFINSTFWPWHIPEGKQATTAALYHNDGKGHFIDVTSGSGLDVAF